MSSHANLITELNYVGLGIQYVTRQKEIWTTTDHLMQWNHLGGLHFISPLNSHSLPISWSSFYPLVTGPEAGHGVIASEAIGIRALSGVSMGNNQM